MTSVLHVETERFERSMNELAAVSRKTVGRIILTRAGAMARYLAESTMPAGQIVNSELEDGTIVETAVALNRNSEGRISGTGQAVRALGRNALLGDLNRVYVGASAVFVDILRAGSVGADSIAKAGYAAIKQQRWDEFRVRAKGALGSAQSLEAIAWDGGERHRAKRNKQGRVPKGVQPVVVSDTKALGAYNKKLAGGPTSGGRVGLAKSAFVQASFRLTGKWPRGVPAWMKQRAPASAVDNTGNPTAPSVTFTSGLRYASEALTGKQYQRALQRLDASLKKDVEIQLQKIAERDARRGR